MMALSGFAEEHGLNAAAGAQPFCDDTDAFDSDEPALRSQAAAERHAELLKPAIIAAGKHSGFAGGTKIARGFTRRSHSLEVSKSSFTAVIQHDW